MKNHLHNLVRYKDLFIELVKKDIKLKYRNSILGIVWSMLNPILMMVVLSIIFMTIFHNEIEYFPVYVLIGRVLYQFFSDATSFAMESVQVNSQLINKIYVPKYFFPLSRTLSTFVVSIISLIPVFFMMLFSGIQFHWINLLFFLPLMYLLIICSGLGLLLSAVNVFFRDMKHFYSIILLVLMYMTPIFYPASIIPDKYMSLILLNPLFPIVEMFRDIIMYGSFPSYWDHLLSVFYALFYGILGLIVFYKTQDRFIYHL
ncbi:ABC transporter permease [Paenibacillus sp. HB172176]|uniref:ABC transporter permease n=1 Tax=Paenibacillus sp. HB172176 TaxID=2493690 RepID=UPI00143BD6F6|nr:ABC transporter permease [Paenibacillus sp. HB172176]